MTVPPSFDQGLVLEAADLAGSLAAGSAALFPTDTLPALACRPLNAPLLWTLKNRPADRPLILMGADPEELLAALTVPIRPQWREMALGHWPGALTLVLPAEGPIAQALHPGGRSLGLRVPACPSARALLRLTGPLATTSANASGEPACLTAEEAARAFPTLPLLGPLPWPAAAGLGSTVLAWREGDGWQVLRPGAVMPEV
jgi:L-threonylcarbamoyladenylate synthase